MEADLWTLYRQMLRSRLFEELVKLLWDEGRISGEMHTGIGEEGIIAGVITQLRDEDAMALVNFKNGKLACYSASQMIEGLKEGVPPAGDRPRTWLSNIADTLANQGAIRWSTDLGRPNKFEVVSLVACPNAIVAVVKSQNRTRARPQWHINAVRIDNSDAQ